VDHGSGDVMGRDRPPRGRRTAQRKLGEPFERSRLGAIPRN
jgi:hypothetical protein